MDPISTAPRPSTSTPEQDAAKERKRAQARERYRAKKAKYNEMSEKLVNLISVHPVMADAFQSQSFRALFTHLPPSFKWPTRDEVEGKVKTRMLNEAKEILKKSFADPSGKGKKKQVALLVDQWTRAKGIQTFTCIDVVYLTSDYPKLKSVVVPVPPVKGRLTPTTLKDQIQKVIDDYNLEVTTIVSDTSAVVRAAVRELDILNPRCAAHELHLSITRSLSEWSLSEELDKLKDFAHRLHFSHSLRETYFKFCKDLELDAFGMPVYMVDRWSSICLLLDIGLSHWGAINATLEFKEEQSFSYDLHPIFTSLFKLLQPFEECNKKLVSTSLVDVPYLFTTLIDHLNSFIASETSPVVDFARHLLSQIETRLSSYVQDTSLYPFFLFDPNFVKSHPEIDWTPIKESLVASHSAVPDDAKYRFIYHDQGAKLAKQIDAYLAAMKGQEKVEMAPSEYWDEVLTSMKFSQMVRLANKDYLTVPAVTVSARRFFGRTGLLCKDNFRRGVTENAMETRILLEVKEDGARAREVSFLPPLLLVHSDDPYWNPCELDISTDGYLTGDSDSELVCSEDEEEGEVKEEEKKEDEEEKKEEEEVKEKKEENEEGEGKDEVKKECEEEEKKEEEVEEKEEEKETLQVKEENQKIAEDQVEKMED